MEATLGGSTSPQERTCTSERSERSRRAAHRTCAVQSSHSDHSGHRKIGCRYYPVRRPIFLCPLWLVGGTAARRFTKSQDAILHAWAQRMRPQGGGQDVCHEILSLRPPIRAKFLRESQPRRTRAWVNLLQGPSCTQLLCLCQRSTTLTKSSHQLSKGAISCDFNN